MKRILPHSAAFLLLCASSFAAGEVLRIKFDWVNAKDCGFEGCKPKNILMKEGSSMTFGWPDLKERGFFEVRPGLQGKVITLKLKRMMKAEGNHLETIAEAERQFSFGQFQNFTLGDVQLQITITEEQSKENK